MDLDPVGVRSATSFNVIAFLANTFAVPSFNAVHDDDDDDDEVLPDGLVSLYPTPLSHLPRVLLNRIWLLPRVHSVFGIRAQTGTPSGSL